MTGLKLDLTMRKRPTFEEVAKIINDDPYKIDLPQRTYIRWEDTLARVQFDQFKESTQEAELDRLRRHVAERMPAPAAPVRQRAAPKAAPGQTTLTGEVIQPPSQESDEIRQRRARLTVDAVQALPSGGGDKRDPDAGSDAAQSRATTVPPQIFRQLRRDGGGGGGSSGGAGGGRVVHLSTHEMQTLVRQIDQSNSIAHGKLQEALAHHTAAHAQTVQRQIEALAASLAHESQRADARDAMSREIAKSLEARNQIAALPKQDPTPTQQNLERMRAESVAAASAASASQARQETLIGQIGSALGGVMQHVRGQNETIQSVIKAINSEPRQTVLNQYGTQYVDQRAVLQDNRSVQQTLNQDNRSLSIEQKILNLFNSGGQSSGSSSGGGGPGPGGGGPPKRPKSAPEQFYIGDAAAEPKQEKRVALAIEDRPKRQKPSQPDAPIALPDRSRQAKRKPAIPDEAPDVKKLAKTLVRAIRKNNEKIRVAQPKVVDVGPATPFKGKGNRLGDDDRPRVITTQFDKKATAGDFRRRVARNQLAITA